MEGPTPVSALIHAATMVTAGVYLIARMWPLYTAAPDVSDLVALIGAATLTLAGLIALVQTDIKRVIAYSTMSQIGYMFCAVGIGAYSAGIFHLLTHAFFKALLFLGAGVVIHALDDEQDIRKMGGLRRFLPFTAALMWIGGLALAGIPPFAGFFSKDQILADAMHVGGIVGWIVWSLGLLGAFVTSIYTFRMLLKVFSGQPTPFAAEHAPKHTAHGEGPISMLWTISVLAAGALLAGLLEIPGVTHGMRDFLAPAVPRAVEATGGQELFTSVLSVAVALAGLAVAYAIWGPSGHGARAYARATEPLPRLFENKFGFDLVYDLLIARPVAALATLGRTRLGRPSGREHHGRRGARRALALRQALARAVGPRAQLRHHVRLRRRCARGLVRRQGRLTEMTGMHSWTATLLWLVPLGASIVIGFLPIDRRAAARSRSRRSAS